MRHNYTRIEIKTSRTGFDVLNTKPRQKKLS